MALQRARKLIEDKLFSPIMMNEIQEVLDRHLGGSDVHAYREKIVLAIKEIFLFIIFLWIVSSSLRVFNVWICSIFYAFISKIII